ncbi:MAG: Xaa-Pro peptidase family protein [Bacteroidales bacterium]|nr:Xaa-Pro peptidase family protein [Bacteroidales bacterium]
MTEELNHRLARLYHMMKQDNIDACVISTNVNLLYTTGSIVLGYYYLDLSGNRLLFVKRPSSLVGEGIFPIRKPEQIGEILAEKGIAAPSILLLEGEELPQSEWVRLSALFPHTTIVNGSHLLRKVRAVKTLYEQNLLRKSAKCHSEAYAEIPSLYRPGMTDQTLSIEIERTMRLHGNLGLFRIYGASMEIYFGSVLAGKNASEPSPFDFALGGAGPDPSLPIGANGTLLEEGMAVMVDMCGNFTGYLSDQTRTFSIGRLPDRAYEAHNVSIEIREALAAMCKPGVTGDAMYERSLAIARQHGLADYYMGDAQKAKFVGHGVGLVINELPVLTSRAFDPLEEGMVFALEPKFVLPDVGAVGVEDTFIVTANGVERITTAEDSIIDLTAR